MSTKVKGTGYNSFLTDLTSKKRIFILNKDASPLRYSIQTKHSSRKPLTHFDGNLNRALRYATNQITPFTDEHVNLQKFLFIHPQYGSLFSEFDPEKKAVETFEKMNIELEAQIAIRDLKIEEIEAVARVALKGTSANVSSMTTAELKRDMLIWAKKNPSQVFDLLNDENIKLRNIAVRAVEMSILHIKDDQRTVTWSEDKRQKVLTAPYGENVYSALALYFKTDEGLDVMQKITNLL